MGKRADPNSNACLRLTIGTKSLVQTRRLLLDVEQHRVLITVVRQLHQLGSANDAEDHGFLLDARRMRQEASTALEELLQQHPFLAELLPELGRELQTGHILGFGWSQLLMALDARNKL